MRVALTTSFAATRKQPLAELLDRTRTAFLAAGLGEPTVCFRLENGQQANAAPVVERAVKRFPDLAAFADVTASAPGRAATRQLTNAAGTAGAGLSIDFATLLGVAAGVPRSFPFHHIAVTFHAPAFGVAAPLDLRPIGGVPGVTITDSWWVSGRQRAVETVLMVHADPTAERLPPVPLPVAAVMSACGKVLARRQIVLAEGAGGPAQPDPATVEAICAIVAGHRDGMADIVARARVPHDLPGPQEAATASDKISGPMKPALVGVFKPMGYSCKGGLGTFELGRRTQGNLAVTLGLDVGTWSRSVSARFSVEGIGFVAALDLPVTRSALGASRYVQYQIGDAARWGRIVDNLAALVVELERVFVPAIEAVAGPAPAWFRPDA